MLYINEKDIYFCKIAPYLLFKDACILFFQDNIVFKNKIVKFSHKICNLNFKNTDSA